jgi:multidrug resistance efflux pump
MVIAPLDHLWVVGNVAEEYRSKVRVGQRFEVRFPFLEKKIRGTLEYVEVLPVFWSTRYVSPGGTIITS